MMRIANSIKYLPPAEWPVVLRARALAGVDAPDLDACLQAFSNHNDFYAQRLAGVSNWQDITPLSKSELAALPVVSEEPIHDVRQIESGSR